MTVGRDYFFCAMSGAVDLELVAACSIRTLMVTQPTFEQGAMWSSGLTPRVKDVGAGSADRTVDSSKREQGSIEPLYMDISRNCVSLLGDDPVINALPIS